MDNYKIHNAIAVIHELFNELRDSNYVEDIIFTILLLIYPITPNLAGKYISQILDLNKKFTYEIRYR